MSLPKTPTFINTPPRQSVTDQFLARARLSRRQRAELAAGLVDGSLSVRPLTVRQSSILVGVPTLDVTKARRANGNGHGRPGHNSEALAEHIARSSPAERVEAVRSVGIDVVWDTMIVPVITTARAAK
jgi:hypothetical protein